MGKENANSLRLDEILEQPDKGVSNARNLPARMFRTILVDFRVDKRTWNRLLRKKLESSPNQRNDGRGNLVRALNKRQITWESMQRGIRILGPKRVWVRFDFDWNPRLEFPSKPPEYVEIVSDTKRDDLLHIFKEHLLIQVGMRPSIWNELMKRHLENLGLYTKERRHEGSDRASNLKKALFGSEGTAKVRQITWERFCEALLILNIRSATLTIIMEFRKNKTVHTLGFHPEDEVDFNDHQ